MIMQTFSFFSVIFQRRHKNDNSIHCVHVIAHDDNYEIINIFIQKRKNFTFKFHYFYKYNRTSIICQQCSNSTGIRTLGAL